MKHIVLCGSYGTPNTGDELILESILDTFPQHKITALSTWPEFTKERYHIDTFRGQQWTDMRYSKDIHKPIQDHEKKLIDSADLLLVGGGGLLGNYVTFAEEKVEYANKKGVPCMVYGVGATPLWKECTMKENGKDVKVDILKRQKDYLDMFDHITVREDYANKSLTDSGTTTTVETTADPYYSYDVRENIFDWKPKPNKKKRLGICLHRGRLDIPAQKKFAAVCDKIISGGEWDIYFIPFTYDYKWKKGIADHSACDDVRSKMKEASRLVNTSAMLPREITEVIGQMDVLASTRLHAMFSAAKRKVRFISFGFAGSKFEPHVEMLKQTKCNDFFSLEEKLVEAEQTTNMEELVAELEEKEKRNREIAINLIK